MMARILSQSAMQQQDFAQLDQLFQNRFSQIQLPSGVIKKKTQQEEADLVAALRLYAYEDWIAQNNASALVDMDEMLRRVVRLGYSDQGSSVRQSTAPSSIVAEEDDSDAKKAAIAYQNLMNMLRNVHVWAETRIGQALEDYAGRAHAATKDMIAKLIGRPPEEDELDDATKLYQRQNIGLFVSLPSSEQNIERDEASYDELAEAFLTSKTKAASQKLQEEKGADKVYDLRTIKQAVDITIDTLASAQAKSRPAAETQTVRRALVNDCVLAMQYLPMAQSSRLNEADNVAALMYEMFFTGNPSIVSAKFELLDTIRSIRTIQAEQAKAIISKNGAQYGILNHEQRANIDMVVSVLANGGDPSRLSAIYPSAQNTLHAMQSPSQMRQFFGPTGR